jgi:hypothetical protein
MATHRKGIQESDIAKNIATETLEFLQMYSAVQGQGCSNGGGSLLQNVVLAATYPDDPNDSPYKKRWVGAVRWYEIAWDNPCGNGTNGYYTAKVTVSWKKQGKPHKVTVTGTVQ